MLKIILDQILIKKKSKVLNNNLIYLMVMEMVLYQLWN